MPTTVRKLGHILMLGLFFYVLYATQFFSIFQANLQEAYAGYLGDRSAVALILDYSYGHATPAAAALEPVFEPKPEAKPQTAPLVYIYNTHDLETIGGTETAPGEAIPGDIYVTELSRLFGDLLLEGGISNLVETRSSQALLEERGWPYWRSYEASRELIKDIQKTHPSLVYLFDIHRDATTGNEATLILDGTEYAVIQIIIGADNYSFSENLEFANEISQALNERYPGLMLPNSVRLLGGSGKNGVYNQDLSPTALLFEIGGQDTPKEAATNSLRAISEVLVELLKKNPPFR